MNVYRCPPAVLPSLRPVRRYDAYDHLSNEQITDEILDAHDADRREKMTRQRAARAPCPTSVITGPLGRWRIPPPPTRMPGPGRVVFE